jgi:hypothetical protein
VSDYVTPNDQIVVRFRVADNPNNSITEAGVDDFTVEIIDSEPSLYAADYGFQVGAGSNIDMTLENAALAGRKYVLVGTLSGTYPGTTLPKTGMVIPVNRDWLTNYILDHANGNIFQNFKGTFDGQGMATATLNIPPGAASLYVGLTMHFAFTIAKDYDFVSNPIPVDLEP